VAGTAAGGAVWAAADRDVRAARPVARPPGPTVHDVTRFGAVGDGQTICTERLQKTIDACGEAGGGTVLVPPGSYATGALFLRSHVNLHLSAGAVLQASQRPEDYPPIKGRDEGIERTVHSSLLTGIDLENVSITGEGMLDGRGKPWWQADEVTWKLRAVAGLPREAENPARAPLKWPRPRAINLIRCRRVHIEGLLVEYSPFYAVHLVYCQDVVVDRVTSRQPVSEHSTGIVVDSSKRVSISNCVLSQGGDGIGLKSGYNEDGRRVNLPTEDVRITSCTISQCGTSGIAIGTETAGGIRNVIVDNCTIEGCLNGVYIRSPRGRGGTVEQIRMSGLVIDGTREMALRISHFFDSVRMAALKGRPARRVVDVTRSGPAPIDAGTPTFRNFVFQGLTVGTAGAIALIEGLPERHIRGVILEDIVATQVDAGISCFLAAEVRISNLTIDSLESAAIDAREVQRLEIHRLSCAQPHPATPAIWMENVSRSFIHGCSVGATPPGYTWLQQEQCTAVTLAANDVPPGGPAPGENQKD
jgi:polygalacturonase